MSKPLISVVVPVYNVEKYLDDCLKSITNQTYEKLEIILVDDGSTDNSSRMCDRWAQMDGRIKVIHKENGGLGSARNEGIKNVSGDYVSFVDSDDWISKDAYEVLVKIIIKYDADIVSGKIRYGNSRGGINDSGKVKVYTQDEYAKLYFKIDSNKSVHYAVNKLYKKQIAKQIHYPVGLIDEDVEGFVYALLAARKIVEIDKTIYPKVPKNYTHTFD